MHIPSAETATLSILTFDDARKSRSDSAAYDRDRWLYIPDFYSEYRYVLGTVGQRPLITVGINPSTAQPNDLDNTLKSVERIALGNGYDSFLMFNVYAQRATNPDHMDKTCNMALHSENMAAFRYLLDRCREGAAIWAAWGAIIEKRDYLPGCIADMVAISRDYDATWYTAGKRSVKGHPHHPLYLKKDSKLDEFDVEEYLKSCL